MASRKFPVITKCLAVSLAFLITARAVACGWGDEYETLRLAFFKPITPDMAKLSPFFYSEHYYNEYSIQSNADRWRNCAEWQKRLGKGVTANDVYELQYSTKPEKFQTAYSAGSLADAFPDNSFIKALVKPANKALLEYFAFAKEMEYTGNPQNSKWESWDEEGEVSWWDRQAADTMGRFPLKEREAKLAAQTDSFLKERYAFILIRYGNPESVIPLYNTYFADNNSGTVLKDWAMLFRGCMTEDKAEQNYWFSQCFDRCEEKVLAVSQWYNYDFQEQTLQLAKNDHERAVILSIAAMRNPGPALDELKQVYELDNSGTYLKLLIGREINKLEDWLLFSKIGDNGPDIQDEYYYWEDENEDASKKNYAKDLQHLEKLRSYLINIFDEAPANNKDYIAAGIAHLSFMADKLDDGYKYASAISENAPEAVRVQKYVELALVSAKQGNLQNVNVQQQLANAFTRLDALAKTNGAYNKSLYTLLVVLASEYNKQHDMATAGLLYLKSQLYKYDEGDEWYYADTQADNSPVYEHIAYFDRFATLEDMDKLVALVDKKNKTPFEAFICKATTTNRYFYLDLKGTIAFRQNNLQLAYDIFKEIPEEEYYNYLDQNPFYPRVLNYALKEADHAGNFSKAALLKKMLLLQKKTDAESYMQLGHAYYNLSYRGNAWTVSAYYQGNLYYDAYFGAITTEKESKYTAGNYTNLTLAAAYYQKALAAAKNDEHRAMASLMLYVIGNPEDYNNDYYWEEEAKPKHEPGDYLLDFYGRYKDTKVFKRFSCPELEQYLK
ncbi:hypothetical protein ACLI09_17070 [Flavobacterium sp. RHBU_24]|uniref:hypothetical protein n=1 Tax=Flavobacterium sp. RHBU_24 TaxID=3391185 RepID=UPI0039847637